MNKNQKNNIESLLENLLVETQPTDRPQAIADFEPVDNKQFSLDQAIDRYFVQYERESIPTSEVYEHAQLDKLTNYLLEQEDPTADLEVPEEDPAADLGGGLDLGGPDAGLDAADETANKPADSEEQAVVNTPQINLQDFARSIARLTGNINSLIDLQSVILNRAEKYVQSNYDEKTSKEFMSILSDSYDLRPVPSEVLSTEPAKFPEPKTAVTGPMGG